jgi:hypothetical protein
MTTPLTASDSATQPLNQAAVVDAAQRAIISAYVAGEMGGLALDLAQVIRENQEARQELDELLELGSEDEDSRTAFGIGMVAGILYAESTGITLKVPPLKEVKAALDAQEARYEAMRKAAPDAQQAI